MKEEQLDKTSESVIDGLGDYTQVKMPRVLRDAFKQGAQWLLSRPLSERLTEEEKEKIRDYYGAAHVIALNTQRIPIDGFRDMMHDIFGTDLFTNQTEE